MQFALSAVIFGLRRDEGRLSRAARGFDLASGGSNKGLFKVGRNMTRQIHCVVQNADDLNHLPGCRAIHDEMTPAPTFARDMQRPKIGENFVTGDAPKHIGAGFERRERVGKRDSVNLKLAFAEFVLGVFQDAGKSFSASSPRRIRQRVPVNCPPCRRRLYRRSC